MKNIITFFSLLIGLHVAAQSPITLTRADFPCPTTATCGLPDSVLYSNVAITNSIDETITGANSNWNMAPLTGATKAYQKLISVSDAPVIFQLVFFGSDYVQPLLGNLGVAGLPITDAFEYYNYAASDSRLEIKGFGANIDLGTGALPLPAIYSSPDVLYRFPLAFGNIDSSNSGFSVTIPPTGTAFATIKRKQKRVNEVDGWGSITTPAGTFDVLRVKSSITRVDSIITALAPLGVPSNPIEYKWLGNAKRIPVFQVNGTQILGNFTTTSITYWGQEPNGLVDFDMNSPILVYPNPTASNCSFSYNLEKQSDIDLFITDIQGKTIAEFHFKNQQTGKHLELLPLSKLSKGTYIMKCVSKNQVISSKLIKF